MEIGLMFGGLQGAATLGAWAADAERLGFASLWAGDHVAFPAPILDPLQVLTAFAAHTTQVRLGTCVYLVPLRHPTVVAKMVSSLDVLSNGRVVFGIGVGGEFPAEFHACEVPVAERGARTNEAIPLLRRLWSGEEVTHAGRFYHVGPVRLAPAPVQRDALPIWVGGRSDAALRRAARFGDGYVGYLLDADGFRERMARVRATAHDLGRDVAHIAGALMAFAYIDADRDAALRRAAGMLGAMYARPMESAAARYCLVGDLDTARAVLGCFAQAGVEHLILTPLAYGDEVPEQIRRLAALLDAPRSS